MRVETQRADRQHLDRPDVPAGEHAAAAQRSGDRIRHAGDPQEDEPGRDVLAAVVRISEKRPVERLEPIRESDDIVRLGREPGHDDPLPQLVEVGEANRAAAVGDAADVEGAIEQVGDLQRLEHAPMTVTVRHRRRSIDPRCAERLPQPVRAGV